MSRFSEKKKGVNTTVNYEGEVAYKLTPKMELYTLVCTASLQKKFYTDENEAIERLRELLPKVPFEFSAKLAIYAREQMYLRSIPLVMAVEMLKIKKQYKATVAHPTYSKLLEDLTAHVIQRADEIPEILSYFQLANEREGTKKLNKLPSALKKGVARAFYKFDEYQFAKYDRDTEVTIRDAMFLTHPKPIKEKEALFKMIADKKLPVPYTWETELSRDDGTNKQEKWESLIASKKVGYMAQLKNLRNMLEENVSNIQVVLDNFADEKEVLRSRQLPFRFFSAYRAVADVGAFKASAVMECLESAIKHSTKNIKGFDINTNVLVACDMSGSMQAPLSPKSKIQNFEIGLTLGMLLQNRCESVITGLFGEDWKVVQLPRTNILANTHKLVNMIGEVGHSTNGYKAIRWLYEEGHKADKVFIFTDCQLWHSDYEYSWGGMQHSTLKDEWTKYKKAVPNAKLYIFDLSGYGTTPIDLSTKDVYMIAGWSEKVFNVLDALEKGESNLSEVERIEI